MTALFPAAALLLLLLLLIRRPRRAAAAKTQREAAHLAGLDTYTPQSRDRFWDDWAAHHGGGP